MNLHIAKLQKCYDVVNDNIENICVGLLDPIGFWDSAGAEPSTKARGDFPYSVDVGTFCGCVF